MPDLTGQRIGNYTITGTLGKGGMAVVYRAKQSNIDRDVAIKVIKPDLAETADLIQRFEREANTVAALSHPHIMKLFDFGEHDDLLYLVMELLSGGTLADRIRQQPLTPEIAARVMDQIADALDYAHKRGLIHRDLKPQNILLDDSGNTHLTDFGIAKVLGEGVGLTQSGVAIGTPAYMSPEQWQGQPLDSRADVYALGVMLFEMLTGRLPFAGDTPASMMYHHLQDMPPSVQTVFPVLPKQVDRVIRKAMAKSPADRFASASELANAFRKAIASTTNFSDEADERSDATYIKGVPKATKPSRSPRGLIVGAALLAIVVVGGLIISRFVSQPKEVVIAPTATATLINATNTPTLDVINAAQATNAMESTVNAARTKILIDSKTATAANWTSTPTRTPTFTPSATVPTLTKTPSLIPSIVPTPTIPIYDDFESDVMNFKKWGTTSFGIASGNVPPKIVEGKLKFEASKDYVNWGFKRSNSINEISGSFTLEESSQGYSSLGFVILTEKNRYDIQLENCKYVRMYTNGWPFTDRVLIDEVELSEVSCPSTHLLGLRADGKSLHFYVDGELRRSEPLNGNMDEVVIELSANTGPTVGSVSAVWAAFGQPETKLSNTPTVIQSTSEPNPAAILIAEDFEDGKAQGFNFQTEHWKVIKDETGNMVLDADYTVDDASGGVEFGSDEWTDYAVEYRAKMINAEADMVLYVRNNQGTGYLQRLSLRGQNMEMAFQSNETGWKVITQRNFTFKRDVWYHVRLEVQGDKIRMYIEGKLLIEKTDTRAKSGALAFWFFPRTHGQIDDVKVRALGSQ
jgi:serine/threonine protein kinase